MKLRKNAFLIGSLAFAAACTAQAAQIDVCGVVTNLNAAQAPVNTTFNSGVKGVHALTTNTTWTKDNEYFLTDRVFVPFGITLTIEPGTKIYGSTNPNGPGKGDDAVGSLVAARGGRIIADGTAAEPIVFSAVAKWEMMQNPPVDSTFDPDDNIGMGTPTVGAPVTNANAGLWGGLVVLSHANVLSLDGTTGNNGGKEIIEGFVPSSTPDDNEDGFSDASMFGYDASGPLARNDDADSGVYRYITIEHGGYEFDEGREINGLTLGGVGAGTVVDHIEVIANQDDGIEIFGGTVSLSHIVCIGNQDDSFDFDSGWNGTMQFFFSFQNPGAADGGFEHDGIEGTTRSQAAYDAAFDTIASNGDHVPKAGISLTSPKLYNGTIIGPGRNNTFSSIAAGSGQVLNEKGNHGFIYDDYYNGSIFNSVIDDFSQDLVSFRDGIKGTGAQVAAAHNTLGRFGAAPVTQVDTATIAGAAINTVTTAGDLNVTVTSSIVTGSPITVQVPLLLNDDREIAAEKIAAALNAVTAITTHYNIGFSANFVAISPKIGGADGQVTNLNIAIGLGTQVGITAAATSANTQVGSDTSSVTVGQPLTYISGTNIRQLFMTSTGGAKDGNSEVNTDPQLTLYTRDVNNFLTAIDPRPAAGSPLLKSNGATLQNGAPMPVTYRGAFGPGENANWAAGWTQTWKGGILQGGYSTPTPPFADADGDGISDTLEATSALTALGFSAGVNNVTPTNLFSSIYTAASILDLKTGSQVMITGGGNGGNTTLSIPLFRSSDMSVFTPAPALDATFNGIGEKEFYRIQIGTPAP